MVRCLLIIWCLSNSLLVLGQGYSNQVMSLFDSGERGIWIRNFEGLSNDLNHVSLVLGNSETQYRGLLMEKGLPQFFVEGDVIGQKLQLLVLDSNEAVVGYLQGVATDSIVSAEWNYVQGQSIRNLQLERTLQFSEQISCSKNKWIQSFTGRFMEDEATFFIQKEEEGQLYGLLHLQNRDVSYTLKGRCLQAECSRAELQLSNHKGVDLGHVDLEIFDDQHAQIILADNTVWLFNRFQKYKVFCGSQIVRDAQLSFVIPILNDEKFDRWSQLKVNQWLKTFTKKAVSNNGDLAAYNLWFDMEVLGPEIVSGLVHKETAEGIVREAFTFDLSKGKVWSLEDFIKDKSGFNKTVTAAIKAQKQSALLEQPQPVSEWLEGQSFEHVTVRKEGLCYHTDYDPLYGSRSVVVPWSLVDGYVRKSDSFKKKLK